MLEAGTSPRADRGPAALSPREVEVLEMAARGFTNATIAAQLQVTVHAVKFHLASIYRKLGVANRTEAAVAHLRALASGSLVADEIRLPD